MSKDAQELREEYWHLFDLLNEKQQLTYIWERWGELLGDVVGEWDEEILKESIEELKEMQEE